MKDYDDPGELTEYIWAHYARFFTPVESKAAWAVFAEGKAAVGSKAVAEFIWKRHGLADDPAVMEELKDGVEAFRRRTAQRILRDHGDEILINRCPQCQRIVKSPKAQQCLWCGF